MRKFFFLLKLLFLFLKKKEIIQSNYNIGKKTWFGTGGKAKVFFQPECLNDLSLFLKVIPKKILIYVIGSGSNTLVRDGGMSGVVIKLNNGFSDFFYDKKKKVIKVGGGLKNLTLIKYCLKNSIGNFEFLSGIPGTIGGSLKMNAGCFGQTISENLISIDIINRSGECLFFKKEDLKFKYRNTSILSDWIIVSAVFSAKKSNTTKIQNYINKISTIRKKTQPISSRTSGSTFQNPESHKVWKLIDKVGYRGKKLGGAQISEKHSNFLINNGNSSSLDIELLGEQVREKVHSETGIKLDWEIIRVGKFIKN